MDLYPYLTYKTNYAYSRKYGSDPTKQYTAARRLNRFVRPSVSVIIAPHIMPGETFWNLSTCSNESFTTTAGLVDPVYAKSEIAPWRHGADANYLMIDGRVIAVKKSGFESGAYCLEHGNDNTTYYR